jgi:uridine kinase
MSPVPEASVPEASVPEATVAAVLEHARSRRALLGGGRLVCVDGPAGSGKTTLATALAEATGARVLHMDDHYEGWAGLGEAPSRIRDEILVPLAEGRPGFYRRYDWHRGEFAELHAVEPSDLLVLEGVGSGSRELAAYRSTLVWVSAPPDLRLDRGLTRDGEAAREHWLRWMDDERAHFTAHGTREAADVYVDHAGGLVRR